MILYFSGTGNSRFVAKEVSKATGDELFSINDSIKKAQTSHIHTESPLVFVTPTYAWRLPEVVADWISAAEFTGCKKAYFIQTCGSETHNSVEFARRLCGEKGFEFMGFCSLVMPENYVAMFPVTEAKEIDEIIKNARPVIEKAVGLIKKGQPLPSEKVSLLGKLMSGPVNGMFYKLFVSADGFRVNDKCINCGKCARSCPLNNIEIINERPNWADKCTHCMACISICPTKAIEYKKKTVNKPRYYLEDND